MTKAEFEALTRPARSQSRPAGEKSKSGGKGKPARGRSTEPNIYFCHAFLKGECTKSAEECKWPHLSQAEVDKRRADAKKAKPDKK